MEILRFLASAGDRSLFVAAVKKIGDLLQTQGEFQEVLSIASEYYRRLDLEQLEQAVQRLLQQSKDPEALFDPRAPESKAFSEIIKEPFSL